MGPNTIPLFQALTEKMRWHQSRQSLLAENVANAETAGYRGRDLKAFSFEDEMRASSGDSAAPVATTVTSAAHIRAEGSSNSSFGATEAEAFEVTPSGNGVTLEDEMMKVTQNQMDYQTVTTLYTRSMRILRTALGRQG